MLYKLVADIRPLDTVGMKLLENDSTTKYRHRKYEV
jgi:hypothetical protein